MSKREKRNGIHLITKLSIDSQKSVITISITQSPVECRNDLQQILHPTLPRRVIQAIHQSISNGLRHIFLASLFLYIKLQSNRQKKKQTRQETKIMSLKSRRHRGKYLYLSWTKRKFSLRPRHFFPSMRVVDISVATYFKLKPRHAGWLVCLDCHWIRVGNGRMFDRKLQVTAAAHTNPINN